MSEDQSQADRMAMAVQAISSCGRSHVTAEFLHRRLNISRAAADELINELLARGVVGARAGSGHPVLVPAATTTPLGAALPTDDGAPRAPEALPLIEGESDSQQTAAEAPAQSVDTLLAPVVPQPSGGGLQTFAANFDGAPPFCPLSVSEVTADQRIQVRGKLNAGKVSEYAQRMREGDTFPAIIVYRLGSEHCVADGFHRLEAAKKAGITTILADVRDGTIQDAILACLQANAAHGLPLTRAERRAAVIRLLSDPKWCEFSDQEIARRCGVASMTVGRLRRRHLPDVKVTRRTCRGRDGKLRTMDVTRMGRKRAQHGGNGIDTRLAAKHSAALLAAAEWFVRVPESLASLNPKMRARLQSALPRLLASLPQSDPGTDATARAA